MNIKPIGKNFGFIILAIMSFVATFSGKEIPAAIYLVGAMLFDAIKSIDYSNRG